MSSVEIIAKNYLSYACIYLFYLKRIAFLVMFDKVFLLHACVYIQYVRKKVRYIITWHI